MPQRKYDDDRKCLWVLWEIEGEELIGRDKLQTYRKMLESGQTDDGDPVEEVRFLFADPEAADYNFQPARYSGIRVYTGSFDDFQEYEPEGDIPDFDTKEDFGIE